MRPIQFLFFQFLFPRLINQPALCRQVRLTKTKTDKITEAKNKSWLP